MPIRSLDTEIHLPAQAPSGAVIREVLRRVFEQYRWFKPMRYGFLSLDGRLDSQNIDYDELVAFYEERKCLTVAARTDRDFIQLYASKRDDPTSISRFTWVTAARAAEASSWRAAHVRQVQGLMRLLDAPLVQTALGEDLQRKTERLVHDGISEVLTFTVRGYREGLAGLFWRNFYGPPFVRLFGERLATLPADARQDLGDGLVLVQPYELPTLAGTPEADARERELIAHLGPECFYDHARHLKPTRLPALPVRATGGG